MRRNDQFVSFAGVIALALTLPLILRLTNSVVKFFVGAEGRLSAVSIETDHVLGPLPRPWSGLAQGAENLKTFLDGNEDKIRQVGTQYVRIDHIFDQFNVVDRDTNGLKFDWTELDSLVAKMTASGATPFFSLSYMPKAISSGDELSEPRDWEEWATVVQKTIEHYSGQLGLNNVYYEVWNEPDMFGGWKIGGKKDYRLLYSFASRGAMKANTGGRAFKFGGPATTGLYQNWLDKFFPYILENKLRLDFFSWHRYDLALERYSDDVTNVDRWIDRHPYFAHVEKIITEMGPNSESGKENISRVGGAHLVASTRELLFKVNMGMNFSVNGGWGVLGTPRYQALEMLGKLGNQRLAVTGEGTWVRVIGAKKGNTYQALLVNYDPKLIHSENVPVTFINLKSRNFVIKRTVMGSGELKPVEVATTEAILQEIVPMTTNSVVLIELTPKD